MPIIKYLPTAYIYIFCCCFLFFFSQILMERLQLSAFSSCLICYSSGLDRGLYSREKALEGPGVHYLANCYTRASNESADTKVYFPYEPWNISPCLSSSPWFCKERMCPLASFPGPAQLSVASSTESWAEHVRAPGEPGNEAMRPLLSIRAQCNISTVFLRLVLYV